MNRAAEGGLALVAAILTGAFLSAATGAGSWTRGGDAGTAYDGRYFHGGKAPGGSVEDRGCGLPGCHAGMPHAGDPAQAAFRNMHVRFVGCLVCHGREPRTSWVAQPPAAAPEQGVRPDAIVRERWKISTPAPAVAPGESHRILGPALACRGCHSEDGSREIAAMGGRTLPPAFADPVALRMIERGAKQWIPDTMR